MLRHIWKLIAVLAEGSMLVLATSVWLERPVEARDARDRDVELVGLLQADALTRGQLAGLYASLAGVQYQPPACVAGQQMFSDVPFDSPFCSWIEELARRGITSGCTATQYCPGSPLTRAQMAVFVVKAMEACPTLDPTDEMIRVGGVCIDKYEASLWDAPVGGTQITAAITCSANGQDCTNIYARSVAGVQPRASITWFQAQRALANSGKRLPTNAEWQMAASGTPDGVTPDGFLCNTASGGPVDTGTLPLCVSDFGASDMVGNVWEWVADWVPLSTGCPGWGTFSANAMCLSGASTVAQGPGALGRGGDWGAGSSAGPLAVGANGLPTTSNVFVGFRGAR